MTTKKQYRNLVQNKDLSDEEFEERWEAFVLKKQVEAAIDDSRVDEIMRQFEDEYDLTGMNINDKLALEQIARNSIEIEELQKIQTQARLEGSLMQVGTVSRIIKDLSSVVSSLQNDLDISRRSRQTNRGETLDEYLPEMQKKARAFLEERLAYIYCPECSMLVCNTWFTDWYSHNELHLTCPRSECQHQFTVTSKELINNRNKNIDGVLEV